MAEAVAYLGWRGVDHVGHLALLTLLEDRMKAVSTDEAKDATQSEFTETHRFVSACSHCAKPMRGMSIDRYESVGPGQVEKRRVYRVWIDPEHDCTYLNIEAKDKAISA